MIFNFFFFKQKRHSDPKVNCLYIVKYHHYQKGKKRNGKKMVKKMVIKAFHYMLKDEGNHEISIPISLKYATQIIIIICLWKQRLADPKIIL